MTPDSIADGPPEEVMEWIDAPTFCLWLEQTYGGRQRFLAELATLDEKPRAKWERGYFRWRYEAVAISLYTVDEFLVAVGRHISELPANLYTTKHWNVKDGFKRATKMLADGMEPDQVADAIGLPGQTVYSWDVLRRERVEEAFAQVT